MDYVALALEVEPTRTDASGVVPGFKCRPGYEVVAVWDFGRIHLPNGETWIVGKRLDKPGEWKSWPVKRDNGETDGKRDGE